jgi:SHS2 domain-containing protein
VYRWVDHTAEVELEIEAAGEPEVLAEALAALGELLGVSGDATDRRDVSVSAPDRPALLAAWLEELVFLAESEGFVPVNVESLRLHDGGLEATVGGCVGRPPHLVKAVTYHRLAFHGGPDGHRARVVFDV